MLMMSSSGLSGHMPFIQEQTAEASDWLQCQMTDEHDVISGEQRERRRPWNRAVVS